MPPPPIEPRGFLPRLPAEHYRGSAVVFWTHTTNERARGWLDAGFHHAFHELMLHVAVREQLLCPIYTLMPDHLHLVWMGVNPDSDQRRASTFLRAYLKPQLAPFNFQHQAHDRVLRKEERKRNAFAAICAYIADNPTRAGLVAKTDMWPFTSCIVPGYPDLHPFQSDFWDKFWRIYNSAVERRFLGKIRNHD